MRAESEGKGGRLNWVEAFRGEGENYCIVIISIIIIIVSSNNNNNITSNSKTTSTHYNKKQ